MHKSATRIRIATYNVHKCRGLDRRVRPQRIAEVVQELDADVIALQEVLSISSRHREDDQARFLAEELGLHFVVGENRRLQGGAYGNVVLSRFPYRAMRNYDISIDGHEQRGCLRVDFEVNDTKVIHLFNVHLGTGHFERRRQAALLVQMIAGQSFHSPRLVVGDFNEWTRGLVSRLLSVHLHSADIRAHLGRSRTYPGIFPVLHLDHFYFDPTIRIEGMSLHRSRTSLIASDHLPLVADVVMKG